ncbi:hypothetical protein [Terrabacter aeriphilus]
MREDQPMTVQVASPVTFRPKNAESRALLEAVAQHRGLSVSKLVAEAADKFARQYIEKVGPEKFASDLHEAAERRERSLQRQVAQFLKQTDDVASSDEQEESSSTRNTHDDAVAGSGR